MRMCTIGDVAHFARWYLRCAVPPDAPYESDEGGIYAYVESEAQNVSKWLTKFNIEHTIEELPEPTEAVKTKGIKYRSRSEALAHIAEDKVPESLSLSQLLTRLQSAEQEIQTMKKSTSLL